MNKTPIEWTDFTVNPFRFRNLETGKVGHHCAKVSPGCANCYASTMQAGPYLSGLTYIAENKSKGKFFLDDAVLQQVLKRKKPCRIFWCDMTDMFLEDYPDEWIDRCFAVMALTPQHTHQVLTKRADRMREYVAARFGAGHRGDKINELIRAWHPLPSGRTFPRYCEAWPLPNVWLGVSVEDQQRADERIPLLLQTPAAVRFISAEPLLGPVDLEKVPLPDAYLTMNGISGVAQPLAEKGTESDDYRYCRRLEFKLDWVIVGGESGPGARSCDVAWVRSIVQQCKTAGVPVFCKQLGAKVQFKDTCMDPERCAGPHQGSIVLKLIDRKGGNPEEWPSDLRVREMPTI